MGFAASYTLFRSYAKVIVSFLIVLAVRSHPASAPVVLLGFVIFANRPMPPSQNCVLDSVDIYYLIDTFEPNFLGFV